MFRFAYPSEFVGELERVFAGEQTFIRDLQAGSIFCVEEFLNERAPHTYGRKAQELFRYWQENPSCRHNLAFTGF